MLPPNAGTGMTLLHNSAVHLVLFAKINTSPSQLLELNACITDVKGRLSCFGRFTFIQFVAGRNFSFFDTCLSLSPFSPQEDPVTGCFPYLAMHAELQQIEIYFATTF